MPLPDSLSISRNRLLSCLLLGAACTLMGCGGWERAKASLKPYKLDIPQGNVITQDMLDKLKPGMTPAQVRFIMGSPLVVDPFRANRWDYVYSLQQDGATREQRRVTVVFEADRLKSVEGDVTAAKPPAPADGGAQP